MLKSDFTSNKGQAGSMEIEKELARVSFAGDTILTVGVFDGVHRGHRYVLTQVICEARRTSLLSGVVTFRNRPISVLQPDYDPFYLTTLEERVRLIKEIGIDLVFPVTFDLELARTSARKFVIMLQQRLHMKGMVMGPDLALGHNREGTPSVLRSLGKELGFFVRIVGPLTDSGIAVRSTSARELLRSGEVERAANILGRNFALTGCVVKGFGRGRQIGFPTANIEVPRGMAVPGNGIYATWAYTGQGKYMAATSIGLRPTFGQGERTVEAFILDFTGDLYGSEIRLEFVKRLRNEHKYGSVDALKLQMNRDIKDTREVLLETGKE